MQANRQIHASFVFTSGRELSLAIKQGAGRFGEEKNFLPVPGIETVFVQPLSLVTVGTQLLQLPQWLFQLNNYIEDTEKWRTDGSDGDSVCVFTFCLLLYSSPAHSGSYKPAQKACRYRRSSLATFACTELRYRAKWNRETGGGRFGGGGGQCVFILWPHLKSTESSHSWTARSLGL